MMMVACGLVMIRSESNSQEDAPEAADEAEGDDEVYAQGTGD